MEAVKILGATRELTFWRTLIDLCKFLFSVKLAVLMLAIFALACAYATFLENSYGRDAAREIIYNTKWFEAITLYLVISSLWNIYERKLWKIKRIPLLLIHISFLLIFIGATATRYIGFEGTIHIREGETTNIGVTYDHYFKVKIREENGLKEAYKKKIISPLTDPGFSERIKVGNDVVNIKVVDYIQDAKLHIRPKSGGFPAVHLVISGGNEVILTQGSIFDVRLFRFYFDREPLDKKGYIKISFKEGKLVALSDKLVEQFDLDGKNRKIFKPGNEFQLNLRKIYRIEGITFIVLDALERGEIIVEKSSNSINNEPRLLALRVVVSYNGHEKEGTLLFLKEGGFTYLPLKMNLGGKEVEIAYGQKVFKLPISLKLEDFIIERYPGSMAPSSYESKVTVIDQERKESFPFRIYMNHTLDYKGFRFFQMSYDVDERGTILSINKDPGMKISYAGFTVLSLGLLMYLGQRIKKSLFIIIILLVPVTAFTFPTTMPETPAQAYEVVRKIDKNSADEFCKLSVQTADGRMETLHSFAIEVANKIHGKTEILGLTPCQMLLGMMVFPLHWQKLPIIKVEDLQIKNKLGILPFEKYFSYTDAIDRRNGLYKLAKDTETATIKDPSERNRYDKEVLKISERMNILYLIFTGELPRIFPLKGSPNNTWYGISSAINSFPKDKVNEIKNLMQNFYSGVLKGVQENDWRKFKKALRDLRHYQKREGSSLVLSERKTFLEILNNNLNIFERTIIPSFFLAFIFFILVVLEPILTNNFVIWLKRFALIAYFAVTISLIAGLSLRWYIAGHAPWSTAYESLVLIATSASLLSIAFARKTIVCLAGSLTAGSFLFVAHMSWLDPQITNLVPVLKSYWLIFHAGITVASYGFLGISAVLGLVGLVLLTLPRNWLENIRFKDIIRSAEISMLIGFVFLNIGNILGAVWAGESWGRYWGWDPKETWTLITILIYAVVLHLKYTPVYSHYTFLVLSVFAYFSVLMTYFGVNFLMSGLHSYASGEFVLPQWIYFGIGVLMAISIAAFRKRHLLRGVRYA